MRLDAGFRHVIHHKYRPLLTPPAMRVRNFYTVYLLLHFYHFIDFALYYIIILT